MDSFAVSLAPAWLVLGVFMVGIAGLVPRGMFHSVVFRPWMLGIMAGMDQNACTWREAALVVDSGIWHVHGCFCWYMVVLRDGGRAHRSLLQWHGQWLVLLVFLSRCVPFCRRQAQDARHSCRVWTRRTVMQAEVFVRRHSDRARRRFRQWHVHGLFAGHVAPRGVFP